jgi:predicted nucleic acid-binding Zn finger protein
MQATTTTRRDKGIELATEIQSFEKAGRTMYRVPSSDGRQLYIVDAAYRHEFCTCADFAYRRKTCKHIHAVRAARGDAAY